MTDDFLFKCRFKHTLHSSFDIFNGIVDDSVQSQIDLFLFSHNFGLIVRTNIETDNDRIGSRSKGYIRFVDGTNTAMDNLNCHFIIGEFCKTLFNSLYRTLNIRFDNDIQILDLTSLDLIKQTIQR